MNVILKNILPKNTARNEKGVILLTINMKHFKDLESPLCQVASPHEFVEKFMSADE